MNDETEMPKYDGMEYEELVAAAQFLWMENDKLRELAKNLYACNGSCTRCVELMGRCDYEEKLHELGIETWEAWE